MAFKLKNIIRQTPLSRTEYRYDDLGRPVAVKRYGVVDSDGENDTFGVLDKFVLDYDGPLLSTVSSDIDAVKGTDFYGRTGWCGSLKDGKAEYEFNEAGLMTVDGGNNVSISYTALGQPTSLRARLSAASQARESIHYDALGRKTSHSRLINIGNRKINTLSRRYLGPFTFNADTLERVDFPGGYFDGSGKAHFMLTDCHAADDAD